MVVRKITYVLVYSFDPPHRIEWVAEQGIESLNPPEWTENEKAFVTHQPGNKPEDIEALRDFLEPNLLDALQSVASEIAALSQTQSG